MTDIYVPDADSPPKRAILAIAFGICGLANGEFEQTPDEIAMALSHLDVLMGEWAETGIDLNYNFPGYGAGLPEDLSGIPRWTMNAVASYLALLISPDMREQLSPAAKSNMTRSLNMLRTKYAKPVTMRLRNTTPIGAGNRWRSRFYSDFTG